MMRPIGITLLFVLGLVQACDKGADPNPNCWEQTTRDDCEAQGDACEFVGGLGGRAVEGMCVEEPDAGWCAPVPIGGSTVPSGWYDPATGSALLVGSVPDETAPGWLACPYAEGYDVCPSPIEACQLCLCDTVPPDNGGGGSSSSGG
jgi:hypothetical protein